jgi:hypothetical protein
MYAQQLDLHLQSSGTMWALQDPSTEGVQFKAPETDGLKLIAMFRCIENNEAKW